MNKIVQNTILKLEESSISSGGFLVLIDELLGTGIMVCIILLISIVVVYFYLVYLHHIVYRFVWREYIDITDEDINILDIRSRNDGKDYLIVENEDKDRFMFVEPPTILAARGDLLVCRKEYNVQTRYVKYFFGRKELYTKRLNKR